MFSKNQYFTIDGAYDFKMIRAFSTKPKEVQPNFFFADEMIRELTEKRAEFCSLGSKLAEINEIGYARMMFQAANRISGQIDAILEWNQASQWMVEEWANKMLWERMQ